MWINSDQSKSMRIYVDVESFSEVNLRDAGVYPYAEHDSTTLLCMTIITEHGEVFNWVEGDPIPGFIFTWAQDPNITWIAHNANFEIQMLNGPPGRKIGFPEVPAHRWIDTAAKAMALGLPAALARVGNVLGLDIQKDEVGHQIMLKLCRPRQPSQSNPDIRWTPETKPEDFDILYEYCQQDVETTIALDRRLPDLSEYEQQVWVLDQIINARGLLVDVETVRRVLELKEDIVNELEEECKEITGGIASSKRAEILEWLKSEGVEMPDYTKGTVSYYLDNVVGTDSKYARRVLQIRQQTGKVSTAKYAALERSVCSDNRVRGTLAYHAAQTGRWGGRIFNPQNMVRGDIDDVELGVQSLYDLNELWRRVLYGGTMSMISSLTRAMVMAPEGKELVVGDYASIEARVVQWLAGDHGALDVFRSGRDIYKDMASAIFDIPYEQVTKAQRFVGKTAILGLGFAMGWKKFKAQCHSFGGTWVDSKLAYKTVKIFREMYYRLRQWWYLLEESAVAAINRPGRVFPAGKVSFVSNGDFLHMVLPSKRMLSYYRPWTEPHTVVYEDFDPETGETETRTFETTQINYWGVDTVTRRWQKTQTYGGKFAENATQAVARDLMVNGMFTLEGEGHPIVLTVHDEIVCEQDVGVLPPSEMERLMCQLPSWGEGIPIQAEAFTTHRYKKG